MFALERRCQHGTNYSHLGEETAVEELYPSDGPVGMTVRFFLICDRCVMALPTVLYHPKQEVLGSMTKAEPTWTAGQ